MTRPIDADAYLKKVCTYNETGCGSCKLQTKCPVDEPTIDAGPARWILLNEKIPEMDERVIVITHGCDYHIWDCMSNRGDDYFWEDEAGLYHNRYEVVAWLPLPEVVL